MPVLSAFSVSSSSWPRCFGISASKKLVPARTSAASFMISAALSFTYCPIVTARRISESGTPISMRLGITWFRHGSQLAAIADPAATSMIRL